MSQLPKEITESEWYKNLPVINWRDEIEERSEFMSEFNINLDEIDEKYLVIIANISRNSKWKRWKGYTDILPLDKILLHIAEIHANYEESIAMGFKDMGPMTKFAIEKVKDKYYPEDGERCI